MAKFKKGQSGNPNGRPKVVAEVRDLARQHTTTAINTLVEILGDKEEPAAARVSAASAILDRGYGKPSQTNEISGKVITEIQRIIIDPAKEAKTVNE